MANHPKLSTAKKISKLFDSQYSLFGIGFGADAFLGLIPGIGDLVSLFFSFYLIWLGLELKLPQKKLLTMIWNVFFDFMIGSLPLIGDLADIFFKSNLKNIQIIERHLETQINSDS